MTKMRATFGENHKENHKVLLGIIGVNYKTASIQTREVLYTELSRAVAGGEAFRTVRARSIALVKTCHRIEMVALLPSEGEYGASPFKETEGHYVHLGRSALEHLLSVASGLESAVPFEPQIADQVENAEVYGEGKYSSVLRELLRLASSVGRRIRNVLDVPYRSLGTFTGELVSEFLSDGSRVLLVGSGSMAIDVARSLRSSGRDIRLYALTRRRELDWDVGHIFTVHWDRLDDLGKGGFDAVVSATKGPVAGDVLRRVIEGKRPEVVVDLSFPRSLDPSQVRDACGNYMNVDDVAEIAEKRFRISERELLVARSVIKGAVEESLEWLSERISAEETVRLIRSKAASAIEEELATAMTMLGRGLGPEGVLRKALERLANRLLHDLTENIRAIPENGDVTDASASPHGLEVVLAAGRVRQ